MVADCLCDCVYEHEFITALFVKIENKLTSLPLSVQLALQNLMQQRLSLPVRLGLTC